MYFYAFVLAIVLTQAMIAKDAEIFFSSDYSAQRSRNYIDYSNYAGVVQGRVFPEYVCKGVHF